MNNPIRLFNIYGFTGGSFAGNVYDPTGIAPSLNTMGGGNREPIIIESYNMEQEKKYQVNLPPELQGKKFRIRKLTPRECFRLMDVDDADIDKIQASGISNSAQYKLAGNSIVVSCLYHIIDSLLFPHEGPQADKHGQLSLF